MKFHEFGDRDRQSIMLIHGLGTTWDKSFGKVIPLLQADYFVIAAGLDGHEREETTDYINGDLEAEQVEAYILERLHGGIDLIYGSSLGCIAALLTAYRRKAAVKNIILDGTADMSMGVLDKPLSNLAGWFGEQVLRGRMNWFLKLGGITPEMLEELAYTGISRRTLKNAFLDSASLFRRVGTMEPYNGVRSAFWYGSKEKSAARGAGKIRRAFPNVEDKRYQGYGHGELLLHPEEFCKELRSFLGGGRKA
jgi:pimeloyl-ACP methyl ester carboxylesterase